MLIDLSFRPLALFLLFFTFSSTGLSDNYYINAQVPGGSKKGEQADTTSKRPLVILENADMPFATDSESLYVTNLFHNKKFYIAKIPKTGAQKTTAIIEPFALIMSHTMLRYHFDPARPIELLAEVPNEENAPILPLEKPIQLYSMLITTEVSFPEGEKSFSPTKGLFPHYGVVVRGTSLTGRGVRQYLSGKSKPYQFPTNYTAQESSDSLMTAIQISHDTGMNTMYNTLTNNCNVYSFDMLKAGRPFIQEEQSFCSRASGIVRAVAEKIFPVARWYPPAAALILRWRGYRDFKSDGVTLLSKESEFIELAKTYPGATPCEDALKIAGEAQ